MSDDVDLLRRAAKLVRETAEAATPGRWRSEQMGSEGSTVYNDGTTLRDTRRIARTPEFADGDHVALFDPAVALAVADWLDALIYSYESFGPDYEISAHPQALALACAILRELTP